MSAPVRFLLIGDVHVREGAQLDDVEQALAFAAEIADERDVDAVLFAGDVFEGKSSPEERYVIGEALLRLTGDGRDLGRPVVIVKGNHDQARDLDVFRGYSCVFVKERIGVVGISGVDVICLPWPERAFLAAAGRTGEAADVAGGAAVVDAFRAQRALLDPGRPFVVLAHLQVNGAETSSAQPLIGGAIEVAVGDLVDLGAAAVVLGHVHKPQQLAPGVEYIGSLTVHDHGEELEQKRLGILEVNPETGAAAWEWLEVPCRRWMTIDAGIGSDGAPVEFWPVRDGEQIMPAGCPVGGEIDDACVRYRYTCSEEHEALFDHAAIERRFAAAHTLKIEAIVERAARVRSADVAAARSTEDKLRAWGRATGTEITDTLVKKLHELEGVSHGAS